MKHQLFRKIANRMVLLSVLQLETLEANRSIPNLDVFLHTKHVHKFWICCAYESLYSVGLIVDLKKCKEERRIIIPQLKKLWNPAMLSGFGYLNQRTAI